MWSRCVALHDANGCHSRYRFSDPHSYLFFKISVTNRCMSVFPVMWNP
jgi:hypothetical protein